MTDLWCVWMRIPSSINGWSMVARDMTRAEAERLARTLMFEARAMPQDQGQPDG